MPQTSTVGLAGGFGDEGAIGTQQESAVFRCNTRVCSVLRDSGLVERKDPLGGTLTLALALTPVNLKTAVDLTAKNTKIAKKDSYEWMAYYGVSGLHYSSPRFCVFCASSRLFHSVLSCCPGSNEGNPKPEIRKQSDDPKNGVSNHELHEITG